MRSVDATLERVGSTAIDLPWHRFDLLEDGEHFTPDSQDEFAEVFASELLKRFNGKLPSSILVLADSTIGYYDWDADIWNGSCSKNLERILENRDPRGNMTVRVDSVCGSGFVARSQFNEHFRGRLANHMGRGSGERWSVVVFVGGWNDEYVDTRHLESAIYGCQRFLCRQHHNDA